jgi:predicted transcriptional regulator
MSTQANTSIKIPQNLRSRLQKLANTRELSLHSLMLQAIESYVNREEKREALRQAGIRAHEDYMSTGLHLTNGEVKDWLSDLAAGKSARPPECHI